MKLLKKILGAVCLSCLSVSLVACDLQQAKNEPYKNKTTVNNKIDNAIDGVDKDGHFEEDRGYTVNYAINSAKVNKTTIKLEFLMEYSFKTNGKAHYKDVKNNIEKDYTYKVSDKVITLTNTSSGATEYLYYYENVIVSGDLAAVPGTLDGVAVSQMGTGTLGYVSTIVLAKGADKSALNDTTDNENKYYAVRKNGTISTSGTRIKADQIAKFDTSTEGTYLTTINISGKTYPAIVHVI